MEQNLYTVYVRTTKFAPEGTKPLVWAFTTKALLSTDAGLKITRLLKLDFDNLVLVEEGFAGELAVNIKCKDLDRN